jgi:hypothetical protein
MSEKKHTKNPKPTVIKSGPPWFPEMFDTKFVSKTEWILALRKDEEHWHPCAVRIHNPKLNLTVTKQDWDLIPVPVEEDA